MDVAGFYAILAGLSFTLLGLWWVACQSRMAGVTPIQVEAILLVVLVLLGTQSAWVLTFARDGAGTGSD